MIKVRRLSANSCKDSVSGFTPLKIVIVVVVLIIVAMVKVPECVY